MTCTPREAVLQSVHQHAPTAVQAVHCTLVQCNNGGSVTGEPYAKTVGATIGWEVWEENLMIWSLQLLCHHLPQPAKHMPWDQPC